MADIEITKQEIQKLQNIQQIQGREKISSVVGHHLKIFFVVDAVCSWRPFFWPQYVWSACSTSLPPNPLQTLQCSFRAHAFFLGNHEHGRRIGGVRPHVQQKK